MPSEPVHRNKVRLLKHLQLITAYSGEFIAKGQDLPPIGEEYKETKEAWQTYLTELTNQYNELYADVSEVFGNKSNHVLRYTSKFEKSPKSFSELHVRCVKLQTNIERDGDIPIEFTSHMNLTLAERECCELILSAEQQSFTTGIAYELCDIESNKRSKTLVDEVLKKLVLFGNLSKSKQGHYKILSRILPI